MPTRIIRLPEVVERTGVSPTSIYRFIREGTFPPQVKLGKRAVGWRAKDVEAWIDSREHAPADEAALPTGKAGTDGAASTATG